MTWNDLVAREQALAGLLSDCQDVTPTNRLFCANAVWFGYPGHEPGFKRRLCRLVGWQAATTDLVLRSREAYDLAYETCYGALPDCRHENAGC